MSPDASVFAPLILWLWRAKKRSAPHRPPSERAANSADGARHLFPTEEASVFAHLSSAPRAALSRALIIHLSYGFESGGGGAVFSVIIYDQAAQSQRRRRRLSSGAISQISFLKECSVDAFLSVWRPNRQVRLRAALKKMPIHGHPSSLTRSISLVSFIDDE